MTRFARFGFALMASGAVAACGGAAADGQASSSATATAAGGAGAGGAHGGAGAGGGAQGGGAGGGAHGGAGGGALQCDGVVPLATAAELASTPRADPDAEILALEAGTTLVASPVIYERVIRDLAALRAAYPELASEAPCPTWQDRAVLHVYFDAEGYALLKAGSYDAWSCLNAIYGGDPGGPHWIDQSAFVALPDRRLRYDLLAAEYETLPHVTDVLTDSSTGDPGRDACLSIDGTTYSYIFDRGTGPNCLAVCLHHRYAGFTTAADGTITALGVFEVDPLDDPPPPPAWLAERTACTRWFNACQVAHHCG
jgi:hypothetical protein